MQNFSNGDVVSFYIFLNFLNFSKFQFYAYLPALFEARCYALHKGRAVCIDFLMRKQWEPIGGFVYG